MATFSSAVLQPTGATGIQAPFDIVAPAVQTTPLVFVSAHSGTNYDPAFVAASRLDLLTLRRSEDSFVDELFADAPTYGAPLLRAHFPRVFLDPNREPWELDPAMFEDELPSFVNTSSLRVAGGLGTIARVVTNGAEVYRDKLKFSEAERRVRTLYIPFHEAIQDMLAVTVERFGTALLIDCHSMPSSGLPMDLDGDARGVDIVLGDRTGLSCHPSLTEAVATHLGGAGYNVIRNNPYAGGYTTQHYGDPANGVHALQIEIKRSLYMDEARIVRASGMSRLRDNLASMIETLASLDHALLS